MGLNCTHGAFDGPYSSFDRFRKAVCEEACGGVWPDSTSTFWRWEPTVVPSWHHAGAHAFLSHSDCDGELSPEQCVNVEAFLRWAAPRLREACATFGMSMADLALRFADGCERAAAAGEALKFH